MTSPAVEAWRRIAPRLAADRETGCHRFTGAKIDGYGQARVDGRSQLVHRVAYELFVGPIPDGLQVDHLCRVRECANPAHLEAVTQAENMRRGRHGVLYEIPAECKHGHPLNEANLSLGNKPNGSRWFCRICKREATRRYRARR